MITFNVLPDDVLLEIFDFCVDKDIDEDIDVYEELIIEWITLAHVCRRWRSVVFQSPSRLNLQLLCTPKTPARSIQDIWPPLPLIIHGYDNSTSSADNIITALEHNDRVCQITLSYFSSVESVTNSTAMQKPFPELTHLRMFNYETESIIPNSFLGGTAPRLRELRLCNVPFPGLPKLLLSSTHLVELNLFDIPCSGYIPPEAMATSLTALTRLEFLRIRFRHPLPRPALESQRPPPPPLTRSILPSLTRIRFKGASEYLEDLLARVDAPHISQMRVSFFNQIIFNTPELFQFISRRPALRAPENGHIVFSSEAIIVAFPSQTSDYGVLSVRIKCTASEWQLSSLEQVCTSSSPSFSRLQDLYIFEDRGHPPRWEGYVENTIWLDLLHPFSAVKNLYLCQKLVPRIAPALQELVGERKTEVLPTLENIFLKGFQPSGSLHEGIKNFVSARRLTNHPVAISRWEEDSKRQWMY